MPFFSFLQNNQSDKNNSSNNTNNNNDNTYHEIRNPLHKNSITPNTLGEAHRQQLQPQQQQPHHNNNNTKQGPIEAIDLEITVIQGQNLPPKDRSWFGLGRLTSSDPFVKVYLCEGQRPQHGTPPAEEHRLKLGRTRTIYKTLHPYWNDTLTGSLRGTRALRHHTAEHPATLEFCVLDEDQLSRNDVMGQVTLNIPIAPRNLDVTEWYDIIAMPPSSTTNNTKQKKHKKKKQQDPASTTTSPTYAHSQYGRLQIRLQTTIRRSQILAPGATFSLGRPSLVTAPNYGCGGAVSNLTLASAVSAVIPKVVKGPKQNVKQASQPCLTRRGGHQIIQLGLSWDVLVNEKNNNDGAMVSDDDDEEESASDDFVSGFLSESRDSTTTAVDLDASCVAISKDGHVIMPDTVYYGNLSNTNRSVLHSGDEQVGAVDGDDESILLFLDCIPDYVLCLYILLTVATPGMTLQDVRSTHVSVRDVTPMGDYEDRRHNNITEESFFQRQGQTLCTFSPSDHRNSGDATAMFMLRLARDKPKVRPNPTGYGWDDDSGYSFQSNTWTLTPMEKTHPTARDFGSLIPHAKIYTRDLIPHVTIDPTERVAILRKGGNHIRVQDYCHNHIMPEKITFGLAWDVSDDAEFIDLDASAICLDANLNLIDMIWWKQLHSKDYNIVHHGDEREGDQVGDDELIDLYLNNMSMMGDHCHVHYIGFVINSYSGQKLKDVARASCHLFDDETNMEIATYAMTNAKKLEGVTALFVGCLYRAKCQKNVHEESNGCHTMPEKAAQEGEWCFAVISEASDGRTVKANVEEFRSYLKRNPLQPAPAVVPDKLEVAYNGVADSTTTTSHDTVSSPALVKEVTF